MGGPGARVISRELARAMGGELTAGGEVGKKARFSLWRSSYLPRPWGPDRLAREQGDGRTRPCQSPGQLFIHPRP